MGFIWLWDILDDWANRRRIYRLRLAQEDALMNGIICKDKMYQLSIKNYTATLFKTLIPMAVVLWKR